MFITLLTFIVASNVCCLSYILLTISKIFLSLFVIAFKSNNYWCCKSYKTNNYRESNKVSRVITITITSFREFKLKTVQWRRRQDPFLIILNVLHTVDLPGRKSEGEVSHYGLTLFREIKLRIMAQFMIILNSWGFLWEMYIV